MRLRRWFVGLGAALGVVMVGGCSADSGTRASDSDDITSVPESRVKEQLIGNCWIYATLGWVESLHLGHTGTELNLSESYLTYMHWYVRITTDKFVFGKDGEFSTGDFFGIGAEIIARYGLMDEGTFISTEAGVDRSKRQETAVRIMGAALKTGGELGTPELRRNKAKVREVLDRAFTLPPSMKDTLTRAFGADLSNTRGHGAVLSGEFRDPAKIIVAKSKTGEAITLDDAIGELDPNRPVSATRDRGERRGKYAWQRVSFGKTSEERAASTLRLKTTLNAGFSVPIDWFTASASMRQDDASFHEPMNLSRDNGWHESLVHDYQVDVPGHGVIPVGTVVTDPAVLAMTLRPDAKMQLLRFKNSWGREVGPLAARGYTDATWAYLVTEFARTSIDYDEQIETGTAIDAFVLPPNSWDGAAH